MRAKKKITTKKTNKKKSSSKSRATKKSTTERDITERNKVEEQLSIFKRFAEISSLGYGFADLDGNIIYINPYLCHILGEEETKNALGKNVASYYPDDFKPMLSNKVFPAVKSTGGWIGEIPLMSIKGEITLTMQHISLIRDDKGEPVYIGNVITDITERKKAEEEIRNNGILLKNAQRVGHLGFWDWNVTTGDLYWSDESFMIYGFQPQEFIPTLDKFKSMLHPDDTEWIMQKVEAALDNIEPYNIDFRFIRPDGNIIWIHVEGEVSRNDKGEPVRFFGTQIDITERKKAEEQIMASLKEKEVLLREVNHRVKNNMAVISSLLMLQASKIKDKRYKAIFKESTDRIKTMALIHEKLYESTDLAHIDFSAYLHDILDSIYKSYGLPHNRIKLKKNIEKIMLSLDTAIPCSLIVNELVSNSLKYAFPATPDKPKGGRGEVEVTLRMNDKDEVELKVGDNGVGMDEDMSKSESKPIGLSIVNALVKQIHGNMEMDREKGTEFMITFRRPE